MSRTLRTVLLLLAIVFCLGPATSRAQLDFGGGGGGGDEPPQRAPEDENQKIREKAGTDDEERRFGQNRPTTPEELYAEADRLLKRGYYTKAQEYLERIRIRFPFSQYATLADLKIGEVYMKKGDYALAVEAFRDFRKLHPNHEETHYAVYMMAKAEFEQAPKWSPRDQSATERALEILDGARPPAVRPGAQFEDRFPNSPHLEEVAELRADGRERLAAKLYHIGRFYQKKSFYSTGDGKTTALEAASRRYLDLEQKYPTAEILPHTLLQHVRCLTQLGRRDEAQAALEQLEKLAPESREYRQAQQLLQRAAAEAGPETAQTASDETAGR